MDAKPQVFEFVGHNFDQKKGLILFSFASHFENRSPLHFTETLSLPTIPKDPNIPNDLLKNTLDSLLLILGLSYFKTYCPKEIKLNNISLTKEQALFWNTVYTKGLGEFFYRNKINSIGLINFPDKEQSQATQVSFPRQDRSLLPFGGGKDSIVSGELLQKHGLKSMLTATG